MVGCMQFGVLPCNTLDAQCNWLLRFECNLDQVAPPAYHFQKRWQLSEEMRMVLKDKPLGVVGYNVV